MSLYGFSVKRPITILMITLVVIILGVVSLTKLPLDLLPKIEIPIAIVSTSYQGAGPEEIEKLVTKPIEGAVATVGNIKRVRSISTEGSSIVIAEFNFGTDINFASLEMREKVDLIKGYLPSDIGNPIVMKVDPNALPMIQLAVHSEGDIAKLQSMVNDIIKPRIERIDGVANVSLMGGNEKEVSIQVDEVKLQQYGLSIERLIQAISAENLNLPAGQISKGDKKITLKTVGEFTSLKEIKEVPIPLATGGVIHLRDIAQVSIIDKEKTTLSKINGEYGLNLSIQKQSGANTVRVSDAVNKELQKIKEEYPAIKMTTVLDQAEYIRTSIMNVFKNALFGAALAILILYIFLRDLKTTLIISVSIPVSIIATFILLYFGKITINVMTLGGLALGVGMLVDNSIVVLENIYRLNEEGMNSTEAAIEGAKEVSMAVVASTLTTIVVFLPIVFVEGMTATIFKELAYTVTFSLLMSLLVSLTLIPMLTSKSLGKKKRRERKDIFHKFFGSMEAVYNKVLKWSVSHRGLSILIALGIFLGTMAPIFILGGEFFPPIDEGYFMVNVSLPEGSSIQETNKVIEQVEKKLSSIEEVETVFSTVGVSSFTSSSFGAAMTSKGTVNVVLKGKKDRKRSTFEVADQVRERIKNIPGAKISIDVASNIMGSLGGDPVNISIKGDELDQLEKISKDFKDIVESVPGTREVKTSYEEGAPEVRIVLDKDMASQFGLTTYQVANAVRSNVSGVTASRYKYEGTEIDIVVKGQRTGAENISTIKSLPISTPLGVSIPLGEIAQVEFGKGPVAINREGQSRVIRVTAQIIGRDMESVVKDIEAKIADYDMPYGYDYSFQGQHEQLTKAYNDLGLSLVLAIVLVFIILASQFESFIYPFVIMLSVPLSFSGAALALLLTGKSLSVPAVVGALILAGIVVNNAIVLVDYINTLRRKGVSRDEAVLKAGPTRLRPILMTTLTTVLGLIPLAIGKGEGSELESPMAVAVIGGLLLSTLLTLVFIPVMYSIADDFKNRFKKAE